MKTISQIIASLNTARSNNCDKEKSEEFKAIIQELLSYEGVEKKLKVLEIIKDLFDFDFALRFHTSQRMLMITNKRTNDYWEIPISQEKYDLLKEVLL